MFKRFLIVLYFVSSPVYATLITHTDYTSGNAITAAGQNSNENTIVNVINGNLDGSNITDGSLTTSDLSATAGILGTQLSGSAAITQSQTSTIFQSSMTYWNTLASYRRPNLTWISNTTVDIENNTGTSNQTCIQFVDERRCVTEDTSSTSLSRRAIITETASVSGTKNSGLQTGYVLQTNTWYSTYGVKATDASSYVMIFTTTTPSQANFATLNTDFGTGSWVYLGMIRYGNNRNITNHIIRFKQNGNYTVLIASGGLNIAPFGVELTSAANTSSLTWNFLTAGFSGRAIPAHLMREIHIYGISDTTGAQVYEMEPLSSDLEYVCIGTTVIGCKFFTPSDTPRINLGLGSSTSAFSFIYLGGWIDNALTGSFASPF